MQNRPTLISSLATAALLAGGCGDALKQPFPVKTYFGLEPVPPGGRPAAAARAERPAATGPARAMLVRPVRVTPPYDGQAFVYRDGAGRFTTDYYANWIAPPAALLTCGLVDRLTDAGPCPVVTAGSGVRPDVVLEGEVSRLLIDRSDAAKPQAVVAVRFLLTRQMDDDVRILSDVSYAEMSPVTANTPASYAAAWASAYAAVLTRLTDDLRSFLNARP